jgi:hypothetical protein
MTLPWPILWLIDPAGAYWSRRTPPPDGPVFSGGVVFGPDVPGGSRQATEQELEEMRARTEPAIDLYERRIEDVERRWGAELHRAAERLVSEGRARLDVNGRSVEARIVRFWRGDSLLETATRGPDGQGESRTRIRRNERPDELVRYLARAATEG